MNGIVAELSHFLFDDYGPTKELIETYLKVSPQNILDIGCSTARCPSEIIPMENNRYVGVDINYC
jgi:hypothetical protein